MADKPIYSVFYIPQDTPHGQFTEQALREAIQKWLLDKEDSEFWRVRGGFMIKCPEQYTNTAILG